MSTESSGEEIQAGERQRVWDEVHEYDQRRAVTEQVMGMLMFLCRVDADDAFDVLRAISKNPTSS